MTAEILTKLRSTTENNVECEFTPADFATVPQSIETAHLIAQSGHARNISFCDPAEVPFEVVHSNPMVEVLGYKEGFTLLGLACLATVLQHRKYFELRLVHPNTKIKKIFIHSLWDKLPHDSQLKNNVNDTYDSFVYKVRPLTRNPFSHDSPRAMADEHLPEFHYAWENKLQTQKHDHDPAYIVLQATPNGLLSVAEMLLDFGRDENEQDEINLESPLYGGITGVGVGSLEVRFGLPGSFPFPFDSLDDFIG